jgi:hypothetical protein
MHEQIAAAGLPKVLPMDMDSPAERHAGDVLRAALTKDMQAEATELTA